MDLAGPARGPALNAALLSDAYVEAARRLDGTGPDDALLRAVALGEMPPEAPDAGAAAVLAGLNGAPVPPALAPLLREGRTGEAALRAVVAFGQGLDGDRDEVTGALATLMALGLEDVARRAALEYLMLGDGA
jgi:hypothetical protein